MEQSTHVMRPALPPIKTLFAESWGAFRDHYKALAALGLPVFIAWLVGLMALSASQVYHFSSPEFAVFNGVLGGLLVIITVIYSLLLPIAAVRSLRAIRETGSPLEIKDAYRMSFREFGSFIWVIILSSIIPVLASFFFIIPGVFLQVCFAFVLFAFVLDDKKGMAALYHSWSYVRGYWWSIVGRSLLLGIIVFAISFLIGMIVGLFGGLSLPGSSSAMMGGGALVSQIVSRGVQYFLFMPLYFVLFNHIYLSLRSIKGADPKEVEQKKMSRTLIIFSVLGAAALVFWIYFFVTFVPRFFHNMDRSGTYSRTDGYNSRMMDTR